MQPRDSRLLSYALGPTDFARLSLSLSLFLSVLAAFAEESWVSRFGRGAANLSEAIFFDTLFARFQASSSGFCLFGE